MVQTGGGLGILSDIFSAASGAKKTAGATSSAGDAASSDMAQILAGILKTTASGGASAASASVAGQTGGDGQDALASQASAASSSFASGFQHLSSDLQSMLVQLQSGVTGSAQTLADAGETLKQDAEQAGQTSDEKDQADRLGIDAVSLANAGGNFQQTLMQSLQQAGNSVAASVAGEQLKAIG